MTDLFGPARIDTSKPHHARVYDYILGGKDNFAADREAAEQVLAVAPDSRLLVRAQRAFLVRVVRFIAESGIRQFIDLGTGIPTSPNVHEVARKVDPAAPVVYVDFDPMVVAHAQARLATQDGVIAIQRDIREPEVVLADPELQALIDFDQPVAVLFLAILHDITDEQDPGGIVARVRERMVPGSYIAIEQFASDSDPEARASLEEVYSETPWPITFRSRDHIARFFDGFELLPPGVVDVEQWRPEREPTPPTALKVVGGVGRKM
jgi:hypothetical protein